MGFYRVWWVFTEFFFLEIVFFICLSGSLRPCTAFHCVFTEFRSVVLGFCRRSSFFFFFSFFFSFLRTSFGLGQANGAENSVDHLVVVVRPPPSCTSTRFTGFFCFFFTEFRTTMVFFVEVSFPFVNADVALNKSQQRPAKTIKARPTEFGLPSFIGLCINIYIYFFLVHRIFSANGRAHYLSTTVTGGQGFSFPFYFVSKTETSTEFQTGWSSTNDVGGRSL